jgi:rRNA maturation RNase YbeY
MSKPAVNFFNEDVTYTLKNKTIIRAWILSAITAEGYFLEELNFIFCSDEYLWRMNQQFLDHDTYTDVITFDNSERLKTINGDIFISIDRVKENAAEINVPAATELCRVMIHGTLHLLGYKDKTKAAKTQMTAREDHYLSMR